MMLQQSGGGCGVIDVGLFMYGKETQAAIIANPIEPLQPLNLGRGNRRDLCFVNVKRGEPD